MTAMEASLFRNVAIFMVLSSGLGPRASALRRSFLQAVQQPRYRCRVPPVSTRGSNASRVQLGYDAPDARDA